LKLKRFISILIILLLLVALTGTALAATSPVRVFVDGTEVQFPDQKPVINADNRTLVPIRFISEALGAEVEWIAPTRTVKINYQGKTILLEIGLKQALVGTSVVTLDTKAELINNRTMVPLRFVSECLGAKVEWDEENQAVYIYKAGYVKDEDLVDSDLIIVTPPLADNPNKIDLSVNIRYKYNTTLDPQLEDLKALLEKRFGDKAQEVVDYVGTKRDTATFLLTKDWVIDGKNIRVGDYGTVVTVGVWG